MTDRQPRAVSLVFGGLGVAAMVLPPDSRAVFVNDLGVAPYHCRVTRHPDGSIGIVDLGSWQGTHIKRRGATIYQRVPTGATRVLCPGDVVRIGSTEIGYGSIPGSPTYYVP